MLHVNLVAHTTNVVAHNREGSRFESPNANIVWPSHLVLRVDASEAAVVRSVRSNHDDLWQVKLSFSIIFSSNDGRSSFRRRWHVQIRWFFFHYKTIFFRLSSLLSFKTETSRSKTKFHFLRKGRSVADRGRSRKLELTTSSSSTSASAAQTIQTGISRHHDNLYALWKCLDVKNQAFKHFQIFWSKKSHQRSYKKH